MRNLTCLRNFVTLLSSAYSLSFPANLEAHSTLARLSLPRESMTQETEEGSIRGLPGEESPFPEENSIGEVKDLILNLDRGEVAYIVGVFHHWSHEHDTLFVIPWDIAPEERESANACALNEKPQALYFLKIPWSSSFRSSWVSQADPYGQEQHVINTDFATAPSPTYANASDILGLSVNFPTGKKVGTITELLIAPETGEIAFVVLSVETLQPESKKTFFALPWKKMQASVKRGFSKAMRKKTPSLSGHPLAEDQQRAFGCTIRAEN